MDAKSLLRAKKAAAKIEHPYASYTAAGQLRCAICAVPVKQWDAHLLTKQHRQSAARERETAAKAAKRKADDEARQKRKRAKVDAAAAQPAAEPADADQGDVGGAESDNDAGPSLPAGFFSAGNQPSIADADAHDGEESPADAPEPAPAATGDAELDSFLASLNDDGPTPAPAAAPTAAAQKRRGYKMAQAEGVASYSAAPVLLNAGGEEDKAEDKAETAAAEPEESEEERRARLAREEREDIMARLEEEERAQEDADSRVSALKRRVEAMKKKREAMKAKADAAKATKGDK